MTQVDLPVPDGDVAVRVERVATSLGLTVQRSTLAKYKGCIHWHFSKAREKGTLEATWWPCEDRLWLSVHDNRRANWIEGAMEAIRDDLRAPVDVVETSDLSAPLQ